MSHDSSLLAQLPGAQAAPVPAPVVGLSIVIPVYRGAATIARLVDALSMLHPLGGLEIVLVNDGSPDNSGEVCRDLVRTASVPLVYIEHARNYGEHNAVMTGLRHARGAYVITMDDDLQNPPEELPKLLKGFSTGADVVYGAPEQASHGFGRRLSSRITRFVLKEAMGADGAEKVSPYRAFRASLRDGFADVRGPAINLDVLLSWSTTRYHRVTVQHDKRQFGRSNYTGVRLVRHAFNLLTGFSTQPLRFASWTGFVFTIFGFGVLVYVLVRYVETGGVVPGFAFLASIVSIFAGAQLFTLGVIGEYLARMYQKMMERPSYVVREATPDDGLESA
jgi:glycosyltransferase involved in cell wall biosynthesis